MIISIIAAMAENRTIGKGGAIPWDLPSDLRRFRELTMGHGIIMGRKTYESIGRPLPGRLNIVLSRRTGFHAKGCVVVGSLEEALQACEGDSEVFVCGGGEIYRQALPLADRIYLTIVHGEFAGDTFFPPIPAGFEEAERLDVDGPIPFSRIIYRRRGKEPVKAPGGE